MSIRLRISSFAVFRFLLCRSLIRVGWLAMDPFQDATVDPWSGKSLGEVEKPRGFDEFWKEQEAGHGRHGRTPRHRKDMED